MQQSSKRLFLIKQEFVNKLQAIFSLLLSILIIFDRKVVFWKWFFLEVPTSKF